MANTNLKTITLDEITALQNVTDIGIVSKAFTVQTLKQRNFAKMDHRFAFNMDDFRNTPMSEHAKTVRRVVEARNNQRNTIEKKSISGSTAQAVVIMVIGGLIMLGGLISLVM